ncbi:ATP-binding cassette domain-containing protein [Microbacterium trichothecenolyticum]|nr:ATP-binding cassette domain-containing protein [Microbacterium trichothecenolyticum]
MHTALPPRSPARLLSAPATEPIVGLFGIVVRRHDGRELLRVDELSVHAGDRLAVTGPSGAGKTLLLRVLAGRLPAGLTETGRRLGHPGRIATIPQRGLDALHPLVPIERQLSGVTRSSREKTREVLAAVGLDAARIGARRPAELSGGQAQRAAIALAVLSEAPIVIADEPTSALDHETRDLILGVLARVLAPTQALVLSTHDPQVAVALGATRVRVEAGIVLDRQPS